MGFPERVILCPPFDAADALFRADEPLGAGRVQLAAHNARLLARRNSVRPLVQHPGWRDFYQPATLPALAPPTAASGPVPGDVQWNLGSKSGGMTFCSGPHFAWRYPDGRWPLVRFSWQWMVEGGHTAAAVAVVVPDGVSVLDAGAEYRVALTTSASWAGVELDVPLSAARVRPTLHELVPGASIDPPTERVELLQFRVFLGAYNSSNNNASGDLASLLGLSVFLVPPT